ncbi:MAG: peptidyl-prolyl cis-trans isomerase [Gammaproteobacteria bacterium]|nr:peptidyl-prolyl cis-trans isomerase [Gammaproteobacteria bacterium]
MTLSSVPRLFLFTVVTIGALFIYSEITNALSIRELLGLDEATIEKVPSPENKGADPAKKTQTVAKEVNENISTRLEYEELQKIIALVDEKQRTPILADEEAFRKFVRNEADNKSVLSAAFVNKIDQNEKTLFLARRGAENVLREIYLNQLIASKVPADFPAEQQIKDYYDQNKDKFVLEERVHVWQIFLPIKEDMDTKAVELLKKQAESISIDLQKGKIEFGKATQQYSGHENSRVNGGYMGLVKVSDLRPEVQGPLMALAEGTISKPVITDNGIHIFKRGTIVPKQDVALSQVHDQIKKLLNTQIRNQLRKSIYDQARTTYPAGIDDKKIEEWRLKLRTNMPATAATGAN